jgi:hypothetical protein
MADFNSTTSTQNAVRAALNQHRQVNTGSRVATTEAQAAMQRRLTGGANQTLDVRGHSPVDNDVFAANPKLRIG